jgi:hypothetical protein
MVHVVKVHDTGYVPRGNRITRPPSCWRCAGDMRRNLTDQGNFICDKCGFTLEREKDEYLDRLEQEKIERGEPVTRRRPSDEHDQGRWLP